MSGLLPRHHGVRDNGQVFGAGPPVLAEKLAASGRRTGAFVSGFPLLRRFGLDRGFDHYDDVLEEGSGGWIERDAAATTNRAIDWIAGEDSPWFAWVHYYDPHDPYEPPKDYLQPGARGAYDGEVSWVDANVGRLLQAIDATTTLVVLTADHGESLGEHGEGTHGFFVYDATLKVPLVFAWPGKITPGQSDVPARLLDIAPTLVDLLGLGGEKPESLDGLSLRPLLEGGTLPSLPAFVESQQPWISYGWAPLKGLRHEDWKLIVAPKPELYNLRDDPAEGRNLFATERRQARALQRTLRQIEARPETASTTDDDPEVLAALASLGYLGSKPSDMPRLQDLADPKDQLTTRNQLAYGEQLLRDRDYAAAVSQFKAVLARDSSNRFALLRAGIASLESEQLDQAIQFLNKAIALDPDQFESRSALADALTRKGDFESAIQQWMEAVRLQPRRAAAWSNLGFALGQSGQTTRALAAFEKAVELEPATVEMQVSLAFAARKLGNSARALEALLEAERLSADDQFAYNATLGLMLLRNRQVREALPRLQRAKATEPDYLPSQIELARIYLANNARDAAVTLVRGLANSSAEGRAAVLADPRLAALL